MRDPQVGPFTWQEINIPTINHQLCLNPKLVGVSYRNIYIHCALFHHKEELKRNINKPISLL